MTSIGNRPIQANAFNERTLRQLDKLDGTEDGKITNTEVLKESEEAQQLLAELNPEDQSTLRAVIDSDESAEIAIQFPTARRGGSGESPTVPKVRSLRQQAAVQSPQPTETASESATSPTTIEDMTPEQRTVLQQITQDIFQFFGAQPPTTSPSTSPETPPPNEGTTAPVESGHETPSTESPSLEDMTPEQRENLSQFMQNFFQFFGAQPPTTSPSTSPETPPPNEGTTAPAESGSETPSTESPSLEDMTPEQRENLSQFMQNFFQFFGAQPPTTSPSTSPETPPPNEGTTAPAESGSETPSTESPSLEDMTPEQRENLSQFMQNFFQFFGAQPPEQT